MRSRLLRAAALCAAMASAARAAPPVFRASGFSVGTASPGAFTTATSTTNILDPAFTATFASDSGLRLGQTPFGVSSRTVALWHLDSLQSTQLSDETLNNHSGTPLCFDATQSCSTPTFTTGPNGFGNCLQFVSSAGFVNVSAAPDLSRAEFTLEAWVQNNPSTTGEDRQTILDKPGEYGLFVRSSGQVDFLTKFGATTSELLSTSLPFNPTGPGTFMYIAAVFGGAPSTKAIYVNGLLDNSGAYPGAVTSSANKLTFGFNSSAPAGHHGFVGAIDEVRISSYAMSAVEIAANFTSGAMRTSTDGGATWIYRTDPSIVAIATNTETSTGLQIASVTFSTSAVFQDCSSNNYVEFMFQNQFAETTLSPPMQVWVTTTAPAVPTPTVSAIAPNSVVWTWPPECGASYPISVSTPGGATFVPLGSTLVSSFTYTGLTPNTSYSMQLLAVNSTGQSLLSLVTSTYTAAAKPTGSTLLAVSSESVLVSWNANGNPAGTRYSWHYGEVGVSTHIFITQLNQDRLIGMTTGVFSFMHVRALNEVNIQTAFDTELSTTTRPSFLATTPFFDDLGGPLYNHAVSMHLGGVLGPKAKARPFALDVPADTFSQDYYLVVIDTDTPLGCGITSDTIRIDITPPQQPFKALTFSVGYFNSELTSNSLNPNTPRRLRFQRYDPRDPENGNCVPLVTDVDNVNILTAADQKNFRNNGELSPSGVPRMLTTTVNHLSSLQIAQVNTATSNLDAARAWPNPIYPSRTGQAYFTFDGLPNGTSIRIYTLRGELVHQGFADGTGQGRWELQNDAGFQVASGIYIVHLKRGSDERNLKVAVER